MNNTNFKRAVIENGMVVTAAIVVINVLVFIISELWGDTDDVLYLHKAGALCYNCIIYDREYYRIFTSSFLHSGFEHIFNNMLMLLLLGKELEANIGRMRFLIIYLISAAVAGIVSLICNYAGIADFAYISGTNIVSHGLRISVGASGAIMGIAGALVVCLLKQGRHIDKGRGMRFLIILLLMCYTGFSSPGIDNFAHIGGLAGGMITALFLVSRPNF